MIREIDSRAGAGFILGTPFFRNVTVILNFAESTVAIQTKKVISPIKEGINIPYMDESKQIKVKSTYMSTFGQYSGEAYIGEPPQGDQKLWAYSTSSYYTIVPSTTISDGWFNTGASRDYN